MDVTLIPFSQKVGITQSGETLTLAYQETNLNHLRTVHASAQFTLAETASGSALCQIFPELVGKTLPVVREAQVKFKHPATTALTALTTVENEAVTTFRNQFSRKGRAMIPVAVEVLDSDGTVTCVAAFTWFVQRAP